jgi:hypothetical protein
MFVVYSSDNGIVLATSCGAEVTNDVISEADTQSYAAVDQLVLAQTDNVLMAALRFQIYNYFNPQGEIDQLFLAADRKVIATVYHGHPGACPGVVANWSSPGIDLAHLQPGPHTIYAVRTAATSVPAGVYHYEVEEGGWRVPIGEIFVHPQPGDLNCDGIVDFFDIDPFVLALAGQDAYQTAYPQCEWLAADTDRDGDVDFFDIDPLVGLLGSNDQLPQYFIANGANIYRYGSDGVLEASATIPGLALGTQAFVWEVTGDDRVIMTTDQPGSTEYVLEIDPNTLTVTRSYAVSGGPSNTWAAQATIGPDGLLYVIRFHSFSYTVPNTVHVFDRQSGAQIRTFQTVGQEGVGLSFHTDGFLYVSGWGTRDVGRYQATEPNAKLAEWDFGPIAALGTIRSGPNGNVFFSSYQVPGAKVRELDVTSNFSQPTVVRDYPGFQAWNFDFEADGTLVIAESGASSYQLLRYDTTTGTLISTVALTPQVQPYGLAIR